MKVITIPTNKKQSKFIELVDLGDKVLVRIILRSKRFWDFPVVTGAVCIDKARFLQIVNEIFGGLNEKQK